MEKKAYLENLRAQLESKMKTYDSDTTVKITQALTSLTVVFPKYKKDIFYVEMDTLAEAGRIVWVSYIRDHLEVEIRVHYKG